MYMYGLLVFEQIELTVTMNFLDGNSKVCIM
jgi:hypothetical protein